MNTTVDIQQVAIIGTGAMHQGILVRLASAALPVLWLEWNTLKFDAGLAMIEQTWLPQVGKRKRFADIGEGRV